MNPRFSGWLRATTGAFAIAFIPTTAYAAGTFNIYGFVQTDLIVDSERVDPAWEDAFRPSKIATVKGQFGSDGQTSVSAKQSRLGFSGDIPLDKNLGDFKFKFDFDAFGVGPDAGLTTIRFRNMYGEWGMLLAGQTNTLFMDIDVFPNVVDYWGPPGMVFVRNPQIRLTPYDTGNSHFSIALERPSDDIDAGQIREIDPALGANIQNDEKAPDLTAQYYTKGSWGHMQLAGVLRDIGYDTKGTPDNRPKNDTLGWGVSLGGHLNVFENDKLLAQGVYGQGIATYMNDGGVDLAPGGTLAAPKSAGRGAHRRVRLLRPSLERAARHIAGLQFHAGRQYRPPASQCLQAGRICLDQSSLHAHFQDIDRRRAAVGRESGLWRPAWRRSALPVLRKV